MDSELTPRHRTKKSSSSQDDYKVRKVIKQSKFHVYLIYSNTLKTELAMKVYPYRDGQLNPCYQQERRMMEYFHLNIIDIKRVEDLKVVKKDGVFVEASLLTMEYAPYGDFSTLVKQVDFTSDEMLVRTYFA